ncbi:hypothetical protein [Zeimonas arvi]|nr:hypothetical protein [Zeimonas arvi]
MQQTDTTAARVELTPHGVLRVGLNMANFLLVSEYASGQPILNRVA